MNTADTIQNVEINALRQEAAEAGDMLMALICDRAICGRTPRAQRAMLSEYDRARLAQFRSPRAARAECERVIREARRG